MRYGEGDCIPLLRRLAILGPSGSYADAGRDSGKERAFKALLHRGNKVSPPPL